ncbi:MAG: hypothetical protein LBM18_04955 [Oscillospiraceae bacterium]|jgi:hypothetical protein|nr:hypothetical protein [Oscillospiraceae bacterium]
MNHKRVTLFAGHYGSGKTNIAVNFALRLREGGSRVTLADLDIVNPYFRTKDSEAELTQAGVKLIVSRFAGSNVDLPAIPSDVAGIFDNRESLAILDIGGDDRGALALGRYRERILEENDFEMLLVVNRFRPLTRDGKDTLSVMREIETAAGVPFTAIVNNSNLGEDTTPEHVLGSLSYAEELSKATGLPVKFTSIKRSLYPALEGKIPNLFAMDLQHKII